MDLVGYDEEVYERIVEEFEVERETAAGDVDAFVEELCEPFYSGIGRASIPPGRYFRMLFVGYFEELDSQRGIAWRCEDSRSLARFLGYAPGEATPDHSTLSLTRERLPMEIHELAFQMILSAANDRGLLKGKTVGVDATDLEANASMKSIVRRDTGDDWREYLRKLYEEETGGLAAGRPHPEPVRGLRQGPCSVSSFQPRDIGAWSAPRSVGR